jgi:hypothetical protein
MSRFTKSGSRRKGTVEDGLGRGCKGALGEEALLAYAFADRV